MSSAPIAVVYLAWGPLGDAPVSRFVDSYRAHDAGKDHTLVIVFNGFGSQRELGAARAALDRVDYQSVVLDQPVLDLAAYRVAAQRRAPSRCCLLNSYSTILAAGWLAHLNSALEIPDVGLVGATASWGSQRSYAQFANGLGGPYARVFNDRRATARALAAIAQRSARADPPRSRLARYRRVASAMVEQVRGFGPFPARHVRSTGFMMKADELVTLLDAPLRSKFDAYRLEAGVASISARIEASGRQLRVVGRDGQAFGSADWPRSRTFWQAGQENLLIADNQTASYMQSNGEERLVLSRYAWGSAA